MRSLNCFLLLSIVFNLFSSHTTHASEEELLVNDYANKLSNMLYLEVTVLCEDSIQKKIGLSILSGIIDKALFKAQRMSPSPKFQILSTALTTAPYGESQLFSKLCLSIQRTNPI